ncbi:transposase [Mesorhizobium sp. M0130]|uniref:transposase n=1 Tax=Mesorhizobium sp. M0130 TaxID=2956887 RepID=UPI003335F22F
MDDPRCFRRSRWVGAYLGLTPRRYQSGEVDRSVALPKWVTVRREGANVILRPTTRWSSMKAWAMKIANRQDTRRAKVTLTRRMAVTLHRMRVDEQHFRWSAA